MSQGTLSRRKATRIDSDPQGNAAFLGCSDDGCHLLRLLDVSGVKSHLFHPHLKSLQGQAVIKMDVGDDRDRRLLLYLAQRLSCFLIRHSYTNDITAAVGQLLDLLESGSRISGICLGH